MCEKQLYNVQNVLLFYETRLMSEKKVRVL